QVRVLPVADEGVGRQALPAVGGAEGGKVLRLPDELARTAASKRREERTIREDHGLSRVGAPLRGIGDLRELKGAAAIGGGDQIRRVRRADVARAVQAATIRTVRVINGKPGAVDAAVDAAALLPGGGPGG